MTFKVDLCCEQDMMLGATAQKVVIFLVLLIQSSLPVDKFSWRVNEKEICFEAEYNNVQNKETCMYSQKETVDFSGSHNEESGPRELNNQKTTSEKCRENMPFRI